MPQRNFEAALKNMKTLGSTADLDEIDSRLHRLESTTPRLWGKMSAHQMICHLNDSFRLYMCVITAAPAGFPYPSKLLKWASLWAPIPWPKGFKTLAELDQERDGTPPLDFEPDVSELEALLTRFTQLPRDFAWPTHPYFGRMSAQEWMRLGYLHTDHHLRQFGV